MKTIKEYEIDTRYVEDKFMLKGVTTMKFLLKEDVLGLIDERIRACKENQKLFPDKKEMYEEFEQRLEELKTRIEG